MSEQYESHMVGRYPVVFDLEDRRVDFFSYAGCMSYWASEIEELVPMLITFLNKVKTNEV